jgi:hypothetical protein
MRTKQHGFTMGIFWSWAIIAAFLAWLAMVTVPSFYQYRAIMYIVRQITADSKTPGAFPTIESVRSAYNKQANAQSVDSVLDGKDLIISMNGDAIAIRFAYEKKVKLFANASLLLEYKGDSRH